MKLSRQQRQIVEAFRKNGYKLTTRDFMQPQRCKNCGHWEESLGIVNFSQRFKELKDLKFVIESHQLEPGLWEYEMTHDPEVQPKQSVMWDIQEQDIGKEALFGGPHV